MADQQLDPERLRRAAPHVAHDVRMLREAWLHQADAFAYTAWFIHCRSVMDFLEGRGTNPDNIHADHYLAPDAWHAAREAVPKPKDYEDYRTAVHKLAAHLTYTRVDYAEQNKFKPSKEINDYLLGLCSLFARLLPPDRLAWFGGLGL